MIPINKRWYWPQYKGIITDFTAHSNSYFAIDSDMEVWVYYKTQPLAIRENNQYHQGSFIPAECHSIGYRNISLYGKSLTYLTGHYLINVANIKNWESTVVYRGGGQLVWCENQIIID